jgi:hypothetical protein
MDFGKLNSPAEVMYFTLPSSSTALCARMRRPFFKTMVSAAAPVANASKTAPARSTRLDCAKVIRRILLF